MNAATQSDNDLKAAVAEVYQRTLALETVPDDCDFFGSGGHSILAVLATSDLSAKLDVKVPLRLIFEHRTVVGLAEAIRGHIDKEAADAHSREAD